MMNTVYLFAPSFETIIPKGALKREFFIGSRNDLRVEQLKSMIISEIGLSDVEQELDQMILYLVDAPDGSSDLASMRDRSIKL